jgi:hypothetical protein
MVINYLPSHCATFAYICFSLPSLLPPPFQCCCEGRDSLAGLNLDWPALVLNGAGVATCRDLAESSLQENEDMLRARKEDQQSNALNVFYTQLCALVQSQNTTDPIMIQLCQKVRRYVPRSSRFLCCHVCMLPYLWALLNT